MADRRTLQGQADDLRAQLATAQFATAEATREANVEHALRVSAEARIKDLQAQVEALRDALGGAAVAPFVVALPRGHLQAQLARR